MDNTDLQLISLQITAVVVMQTNYDRMLAYRDLADNGGFVTFGMDQHHTKYEILDMKVEDIDHEVRPYLLTLTVQTVIGGEDEATGD